VLFFIVVLYKGQGSTIGIRFVYFFFNMVFYPFKDKDYDFVQLTRNNVAVLYKGQDPGRMPGYAPSFIKDTLNQKYMFL